MRLSCCLLIIIMFKSFQDCYFIDLVLENQSRYTLIKQWGTLVFYFPLIAKGTIILL